MSLGVGVEVVGDSLGVGVLDSVGVSVGVSEGVGVLDSVGVSDGVGVLGVGVLASEAQITMCEIALSPVFPPGS